VSDTNINENQFKPSFSLNTVGDRSRGDGMLLVGCSVVGSATGWLLICNAATDFFGASGGGAVERQ
jgi:hypothetical protein